MPFALLLVMLAAQVVGPFDQNVGPFDPGPGPWQRDLSENVVRQVHRGPFDGTTTVWVRVLPKADDPRVAPTTFVFVAQFPGRSPRTRPVVTWYVETNVKYYPLLQRTASLEVSIDGAPSINLLAEKQSRVGYCCGGDDSSSLPASVTSALSAERLDRLAAAKSVTGTALGVPFAIDQQQLRAVADFRRRLLPDAR